MNLNDKIAVITGGSRGLGLGVVEALVERGAKVTVVARGSEGLSKLRKRLSVHTIAADATDEESARRIVSEVRPEILMLNAGAEPRMGRLDQISWADFSATWETDVRAGLNWVRAALQLPLGSGSRVLIASSGAAVGGSPLSGGYAGAKRMLWFMAKYANTVVKQQGLGIRFQVIVPHQMFAGTGVGEAGAAAYAKVNGLEPSEFLARSFPAMTIRQFGEHVAAILEGTSAEGLALGIRGDSGVSVLEGDAA